MRRLHWWAAAPWRAEFRFCFPECDRPQPVSVVADTRAEAYYQARVLRWGLSWLKYEGRL